MQLLKLRKRNCGMPEHGAECPRDGVLGDVFTIGGKTQEFSVELPVH
jgi:hypothetical protein